MADATTTVFCEDLNLAAIGLGMFVCQCLTLYFGVGLLRLQIAIAKGGTERLGQLFYRPQLMLLLQYIVLSVMLLLGVLIGTICLLIPGTIFQCRFGLSLPSLIDKKKGIKAALAESLQLTKGLPFSVYCFVFLCSLLSFPAAEFLVWIAFCYIYAYKTYGLWTPKRANVLNVIGGLFVLPIGLICCDFINTYPLNTSFESRLVSTDSMAPSLQKGDQVLIDKSCKFGLRKINRGDIVLLSSFDAHGNQLFRGNGTAELVSLYGNKSTSSPFPAQLLVYLALPILSKFPIYCPYEAYLFRVIGAPGDTVEIVAGQGVFVNGRLLQENYIKHPAEYSRRCIGEVDPDSYNIVGPGMNTYLNRERDLVIDRRDKIVVPPGQLFLLSDDRKDSSYDSHRLGLINDSLVIGRVWIKHPDWWKHLNTSFNIKF